jgi:hypothetical protein
MKYRKAKLYDFNTNNMYCNGGSSATDKNAVFLCNTGTGAMSSGSESVCMSGSAAAAGEGCFAGSGNTSIWSIACLTGPSATQETVSSGS